MEILNENSTLSFWLLQYGSFALFILMALGIIALPVPEETLMVVAGILMAQQKLPIQDTIIASLAGSITGITVSYLLGKSVGHYFFHTYGKWLGITEKRLAYAHEWFEKFGKWALLIGYFIPGVRHFTGFTAGTTELEFKYFTLFAYLGAFLWVATFLSVGYFFGDHWHVLYKHVEANIEICLYLLGLIFLMGAFYWFKKKN